MKFGYLDEFMREQKERFEKFDRGLASARYLSRDVIYKIIILCSSIIGFSLTLMSLPNLKLNLNIELLKTSWYLLLLTIILGFTSIFVEGRLHYALEWRSFQLQEYEKYHFNFLDRFKIIFISLWSIIFPRNLIFCGAYKTKDEVKYNSLLNARIVMTLAELEKLTFYLENIFIIVFITALVIFVKSYK